MEARIALRGSDPETLRVRQNLQTLGSWRHRQVQDGPLPATERTRLLTDFRMSDEERKPWEERASAIADGVAFEVFIDTLNSRPPPDSAFIFMVKA